VDVLPAPRVSDSVPLAQLPVAEQARRRADAESLENQVRDIARSARAGESKAFSIEITQEQVNTLLQDRVDLSKFPVRNLRVGFEPGRVVAQGDVDYKGISAGATLAGTVTLQNGQLVYVTETLLVQGIPAPGDWKGKIDGPISEQLNRALANAPGTLEEVRIESGKMIVSGRTRGGPAEGAR
jgi:hypothetical protein